MRSGILLGALSTALFAISSVATIPPALAAFPGSDGGVAVTLHGDIWLKAPGQPAQQLTASGLDGSPRWSPDGSTLAFPRGGKVVLLVVQSGAESVVPQLTDVRDVAWSGDGTQLIVSRTVMGRRSTIWTVNLDGNDLMRIARPGPCSREGLRSPAWSADGHYAVFKADTAPSLDLGRSRCGHLVLYDFVTGSRSRIHLESGWLPGERLPVVTPQPTFTPDSSEVVAGVALPDSFSAVARYSLLNGQIDVQTLQNTTEDCRFSGTGICYEYMAGWAQATPSGSVANLYHDVSSEPGEPVSSCLSGVGALDCSFPWEETSGFDVRPVVALS